MRLSTVVMGPILVLLAAPFLCSAYAPADRGLRRDLYEKIYDDMLDARPCVRLLRLAQDDPSSEETSTVHGCGSPRGGTIGRIVDAETAASASAALEDPPRGDWIALLSAATLSPDTLKALSESGCVGALVTPGIPEGAQAADPPFAFSPESATLLPPPPGAAAASGHAWNPHGSGLRYENVPFPIFLLTDGGSPIARRAAASNAEHPRRDFPRLAAQLNAFMFVPRAGSSASVRRCMKRGHCEPLGGYTIMATVSPDLPAGAPAPARVPFAAEMGIDSSRETVLVTATADATAVFHDLAVGAQGSLSGAIAAAAAVRAIGLAVSRVVAAPGPGDAPLLARNLVLSLLEGEAYDGIGSRRLARDIAERPPCDEGPASGEYCARPYVPSLAYEGIAMDAIAALVDVGEVGGNGTAGLYARAAGDARAASAVRDVMANAAAGAAGSGARPILAATPLDGSGSAGSPVPPSPLTAFLAFNGSLPALRVTSWDREMASRFYRSRFDTLDNVNTAQICAAAKSLAPALYDLAGPSPSAPATADIPAMVNCTDIDAVMKCLAYDDGDENCPLTREILNVTKKASEPRGTFTHYVGVSRRAIVTRYMALLRGWVARGPEATNMTTWYHNAIPADVIGNEDGTGYDLADTLRDPVWVESTWDGEIGVRVFMQDSPVSQTVVVIMGIVATAGTYVFSVFAKRHWIATMKRD